MKDANITVVTIDYIANKLYRNYFCVNSGSPEMPKCLSELMILYRFPFDDDDSLPFKLSILFSIKGMESEKTGEC